MRATDAARLLAVGASLAGAFRVAAMTVAALGQICLSELFSVLISLTPLVQLVLIGVVEGIERTPPKLAMALYLMSAALLVPQQLLIAYC